MESVIIKEIFVFTVIVFDGYFRPVICQGDRGAVGVQITEVDVEVDFGFGVAVVNQIDLDSGGGLTGGKNENS